MHPHAKHVTVRFPWNKTADTPVFNGIPPHTVQLAKLESIERKVEQLEDKLIGRLDEMMTDRGFSSTQFKTQDIVLHLCQNSPGSMPR